MKTENFKLLSKFTGRPLLDCVIVSRANTSTRDSHLFDIVEPRHPCAGGLTIEDIQRRLAQYVETFLISSSEFTDLFFSDKYPNSISTSVSILAEKYWVNTLPQGKRKCQQHSIVSGLISKRCVKPRGRNKKNVMLLLLLSMPLQPQTHLPLYH